jgi:hypothetical protein
MRSDSFLLLLVLRAAPSLPGSAVLAADPTLDTHSEQPGLSEIAVLLICLRQPAAPSCGDTFHASSVVSFSLLN